jgi:predicted TIM-barrel fold metal-dependent hydrolase
MTPIIRRDVMKFALASAGFAIGELGNLSPLWAQTNARAPVIDVHAHIFNATDIPARTFLRIVVLGHYPEQATEKLLDFRAPDTVDWLISLFVWIVADRAPTARAEIAFLSGNSGIDAPADVNASATITQQRLKTFMERLDRPASAGNLAPASAPKLPAISKGGRERLRAALKKAGGGSKRQAAGLTAGEFSASAAFASPTDIGAYLRWFNLFTLYRHTLADQLSQAYDAQNLRPLLIAPAIVNYSRWLGEEVASPLEDQVEVMGYVSKRAAAGAMVHGYVGYDPLEQVFHRRGFQGHSDQIALIRSAVEDHGFIGVKLYPPMGFKPLHNAPGQSYPKPVLDKLGGRLSDDLNLALEELFQLCVALDVPVLAHAAASNGSGPEYAGRGDPAFWLPVLARYPKLRLCLAHFGRFTYRSAAVPPSLPLPDSSWEWVLGKQIRNNPGSQFYADLSYLTEAQASDAENRRNLGRQMRRYISEFDPKLDHLLYGSDWIMLGKEPRNATYATDLASFLKVEIGLDQQTLDRVLRLNAVRFLGLLKGNGARERLTSFYRRNSLDERRLEIFDVV